MIDEERYEAMQKYVDFMFEKCNVDLRAAMINNMFYGDPIDLETILDKHFPKGD